MVPPRILAFRLACLSVSIIYVLLLVLLARRETQPAGADPDLRDMLPMCLTPAASQKHHSACDS